MNNAKIAILVCLKNVHSDRCFKYYNVHVFGLGEVTTQCCPAVPR
jgi:hypothetical protein